MQADGRLWEAFPPQENLARAKPIRPRESEQTEEAGQSIARHPVAEADEILPQLPAQYSRRSLVIAAMWNEEIWDRWRPECDVGDSIPNGTDEMFPYANKVYGILQNRVEEGLRWGGFSEAAGYTPLWIAYRSWMLIVGFQNWLNFTMVLTSA